MRDSVNLNRDVTAIQIPYGEKMELKAGSLVMVTQALGGSVTVMSEEGYLVRIEEKDLDALGMEPPKREKRENMSLEDQAWEELRTVYDPEIPVNIVDLGLIYACQVNPIEGGNRADVQMTLTAPGCGIGDVLKVEVERKLAQIPGITQVAVEVVLDPPWEPSMMTEAARLATGMMW